MAIDAARLLSAMRETEAARYRVGIETKNRVRPRGARRVALLDGDGKEVEVVECQQKDLRRVEAEMLEQRDILRTQMIIDAYEREP